MSLRVASPLHTVDFLGRLMAKQYLDKGVTKSDGFLGKDS
jgi:hypothetical protein